MPGVSEINNWGGEVKQYQITVDPALLTQYSLTLRDVAQRVVENNANFGGGYIEHSDEQYTLRGEGRAQSIEDIGNIVLLSSRGVPVLLSDVAQVGIGPAPRLGAVLRNGETISGMVIMLKGENGNLRRCSCRSAPQASSGADDRLRCELWLHPDGALDIYRR